MTLREWKRGEKNPTIKLAQLLRRKGHTGMPSHRSREMTKKEPLTGI